VLHDGSVRLCWRIADAGEDAWIFFIHLQSWRTPILMVRARMAVCAYGDEVFNAVILALCPRNNVRLFQRERITANRTVVSGFNQDQTLRFCGDGGAVLGHSSGNKIYIDGFRECRFFSERIS
jgi:hypothetical protein